MRADEGGKGSNHDDVYRSRQRLEKIVGEIAREEAKAALKL